jgi:hypothetical protein
MSTDAPQVRPTTLTFDEPERSELLRLVEAALGELRVEIHRTHTPDYRAQLHQREHLLKRLMLDALMRHTPLRSRARASGSERGGHA